MMEKGTSDERLLKIIEGSAENKLKHAIGSNLKKPLSGLIPGRIKFSLPDFKVSLLNLNKGLIGLACLLTLVFFYTLFSGPVVSASSAAYFNPADAGAIAKVIASGASQGLLRQDISGRQINKNIFLPSGQQYGASSEESGPNLSEMVKDLKLVGIIWSSAPEVMIENAKDSRTYTLKKGESFNNEQFKVKEISRNSAILEVSSEGKSSEYILR